MPASHVSADQYAAQGINLDLLLTIMSMIGAVNASDCPFPGQPRAKPVAVAPEDIHKLTGHMLAAEKAERFSVGDYEMIALRFAVEDDGGRAVTLLAIEDYHSPYPCLVDGHVTDRSNAIRLWLGDTDGSEHPDLYLVTQ